MDVRKYNESHSLIISHSLRGGSIIKELPWIPILIDYSLSFLPCSADEAFSLTKTSIKGRIFFFKHVFQCTIPIHCFGSETATKTRSLCGCIAEILFQNILSLTLHAPEYIILHADLFIWSATLRCAFLRINKLWFSHLKVPFILLPNHFYLIDFFYFTHWYQYCLQAIEHCWL
jgi:hypothetical protein